MRNKIDVLEVQRTYMDGKMKRINLLFAVNGGAFAIVKLGPGLDVLGDFTLSKLAVGATVFTILMWWDIWGWAQGMRRRFPNEGIFTKEGEFILKVLTGLLIAGWILAAWNDPAFAETGQYIRGWFIFIFGGLLIVAVAIRAVGDVNRKRQEEKKR